MNEDQESLAEKITARAVDIVLAIIGACIVVILIWVFIAFALVITLGHSDYFDHVEL